MPYPEENQSMHAGGTMFVLHYDKLFFVTKKLALLFCELLQTFIPKFVLDLVRLPSHVAKLM